MKVNSVNDCYEYMRLTHLISVCWGLPIIRKKTNKDFKYNGDTDVQGNTIYYIYNF